jgi:hypothetical protein
MQKPGSAHELRGSYGRWLRMELGTGLAAHLGPLFGALIEGIAHPLLLGTFHSALDKVIVDAFVHERARSRCATLPLFQKCCTPQTSKHMLLALQNVSMNSYKDKDMAMDRRCSLFHSCITYSPC